MIIIGNNSFINEGDFFIEDDNGGIFVGNDTTICGYTHLACIEGRTITIGDNCLFSANITLRTGDSHSIVDCATNKRINPSDDVRIEDHVWVGNQVTILKGVTVPKHSIIGTGAILTKSFSDGNVVIAGNPAKIIKNNVDWKGERIKGGN